MLGMHEIMMTLLPAVGIVLANLIDGFVAAMLGG
jgi:hypothetical protein